MFNQSEAPSAVAALDKDLRTAAKELSDDEARFLVDAYYTIQKDRIRAENQCRALSEEPHAVLEWLMKQNQTLENNIKISLDVYTHNHPVGEWLHTVKGIGPVISAGLLAHIDIRKAPTVGHIWSFAGLTDKAAWLGGTRAEKAVRAIANETEHVTPDRLIKIANSVGCCPKWLARRSYRAATGMDLPYMALDTMEPAEYIERLWGSTKIKLKAVIAGMSKRPWNARLKVLCWKAGESFVKVSGNEDAVYGRLYKERKELETRRNEAGEYTEQAASILSAKRVGKDTEAHGHYSAGRLPPAHIHSRAKRYAVKLFLSDLHREMYRRILEKEPPLPYPIAHMDHAHLDERP